MPTDERRLKTPDEVREYKQFMEEKVRGIIRTHGEVHVPSDPYDKGCYDAIRWVPGECP